MYTAKKEHLCYISFILFFFNSPLFAQKSALPRYRRIFKLTTQFSNVKAEKPFHLIINYVTRSLNFKSYPTLDANPSPNVYTLTSNVLLEQNYNSFVFSLKTVVLLEHWAGCWWLTRAQRRSTASRMSSWCPILVTPNSSSSWWVMCSSCSPPICSRSKFFTYCWRQSSRPDEMTEGCALGHLWLSSVDTVNQGSGWIIQQHTDAFLSLMMMQLVFQQTFYILFCQNWCRITFGLFPHY